MKVLQLISSGGLYGAEAVILDLARTLGQTGHAALIGAFVNSAHPNTQLEVRARSEGLEVRALPCHGQLDRSLAPRLRELLKDEGVDVVHAHGYKADVYAFWALRGSGVPVVSTCHTWYDNDLALRAYGMLDRLVLRRFQGVVAVSDEVRRQLLGAGVAAARVRLIRNGVDLSAFGSRPSVPSSGLTPCIGLIGRLSPEKGVDLFVRAAPLVLTEFPQARFVVVGEGPDRPALESLIRELHLEDRVSLLGRREDMVNIYASLDLLVSASRQEGLPIALLEGMASGLPIVAARAGEVPTIVEEGATGLLVGREDPQALAAAIAELLRDPARRCRMGARARLRAAAEFSAERMTADYLHLYEKVLAEPRP